MPKYEKVLFRYQREAGSDAWAPSVQEAAAFINRKPMPYGRGMPGHRVIDQKKVEMSYVRISAR